MMGNLRRIWHHERELAKEEGQALPTLLLRGWLRPRSWSHVAFVCRTRGLSFIGTKTRVLAGESCIISRELKDRGSAAGQPHWGLRYRNRVLGCQPPACSHAPGLFSGWKTRPESLVWEAWIGQQASTRGVDWINEVTLGQLFTSLTFWLNGCIMTAAVQSTRGQRCAGAPARRMWMSNKVACLFHLSCVANTLCRPGRQGAKACAVVTV